MKFVCDQGHQFLHPAKRTSHLLHWETHKHEFGDTPDTRPVEVESSVCPECQSIHYTESPEIEPQVQNVYIYDLTSGAQTELDGLLAQGYKITAKYAKQYHLEKLKETKTE